jgi:signal transduction histidine kinase
VLLTDSGRPIAHSTGIGARALSALATRVRGTRGKAGSFSLSDVIQGATGTKVIELAITLPAARGTRVLVSAYSPTFASSFMRTYLASIRPTTGTAYVVDSRGNVVGASDARPVVGRPLTQPGLLQAVQGGTSGSFEPDGYFDTVPVRNTSWRVALAAPHSRVFATVSGMRMVLPWLILAALALVGVVALVLLRRLLSSAADLGRANRELQTGNAKLESTNVLLRHAAELARSNAELEQFASIASHDLQEPLRKVQTFAAQLTVRESDNLSEEGQDYLRRMTAAAGRMRALIDDLLTFSRVDTKGRAFVPVDLNQVVAEVLTDLEISIGETGASVQVGALPTIDADAVQMQQLFQNLIANAVKFRREGCAPEIQVEGRIVEGVAELSVRDNGIGFETRHASRIFRAFERLHGVQAYPGTGIGLALCRKIVERHHGTITATSKPGSGSRFSISLPVEQSAPPPGAAPDNPVIDERDAVHV